MNAEERLAKQAALQLVLQGVDSKDLSKMLWELGYSAGLIVGTRDSADTRMRELLESGGGVNRADITDKLLQKAHDTAVRDIRAHVGSCMMYAAEIVGKQFRKTRRTLHS